MCAIIIDKYYTLTKKDLKLPLNRATSLKKPYENYLNK